MCHIVAGGVALRLAGIAVAGDDGDFEYVKKSMLRILQSPAKNLRLCGKRAQDAVAVRLNETATRQKVQAKSEAYFRLLYPWG